LRIKEQETRLTFHEHDDDDDYMSRVKASMFVTEIKWID
jgi:hypothetical protein